MDPFERPYWNQLQVVLWVCSRSRGAVRLAADPPGLDAVELIAEVVMPGGRIGKRWRSRSRVGVSFEDAEKKVIDALCRGDLQAAGVEKGRGDRKSIPKEQWADLRFYWAPIGYYDPLSLDRRHYPSLSAGLRELSRPNAPHWTDVFFERGAVLDMWRDPLENRPDRGLMAAAPAHLAKMPETHTSNETPVPGPKRVGRRPEFEPQLFEAEARRRLDANAPKERVNLTQFARNLQKWYESTYGVKPPSESWIERVIRSLVRESETKRQK